MVIGFPSRNPHILIKFCVFMSTITSRHQRGASAKNLRKVQVKRMVLAEIRNKAELKALSSSFTAQTGSAAGVVLPITQGIIQGDSLSQRTGNQISLEKFQLFLGATNGNPLTGSAPCVLRFIVFQDTQNIAVLPAVTDVLNSANYYSWFNISLQTQEKRFKILSDHSVTLTNVGSNEVVTHKWDFGSKMIKKVTYFSTTNISSANGKNSLFVLVISSTNVPLYDLGYQVQYLDM